jgi:ribosomal protein L11 methyltransferase
MASSIHSRASAGGAPGPRGPAAHAAGYWELTVGVPGDLSEGLTNLAWELGALGVVEEERPGSGATLRAFFPETVAAATLEESVRQYLDGLRELGFAPARDLRVAALADENWAEAWRAHFTPRSVGRRLLIVPPWNGHAADGRLVITIEPGRAFGTGHHGTTAGCLEAIEAVVERDHPSRMIDVGTGSGILAIAAARLGVGAVLAVDDDPDAVACAMANAARNHVSDRVRCVLADAAALREPRVPLLVANILSAAHRRLAEQYRRSLAAGGTLLLGGILDAEATDVVAALADHELAYRTSWSVEGWTTLELRAPIHDRA